VGDARRQRRFLLTSLQIFIRIMLAVASVSTHIAASSLPGALSCWRKRSIDPTLALLGSSVVGTFLSVWLFTLLRAHGQLDLVIALSYVVLLTGVSSRLRMVVTVRIL
jgi:hypothetical protein